MSVRAASLISIAHGLALAIGFAQQVVFVAIFGVDDVAGVFFVALTLPTMIALIFGESLQVGLLPDLMRLPAPGERHALILRYWRHGAQLQAAGMVVAIGWGAILDHRIGPWWPDYLFYIATTTSAFFCAMVAATLVVWLQVERDFLRPALLYALPGAMVMIVSLISHSVHAVALSYLAVGILQVVLLLYWARTFRAAQRATAATWVGSTDLPSTNFAALIVGAAIPATQIIDRLAHSLEGLARAASAAYLWALILGIGAVLSRGPTLLFSLWVVERADHGRVRLIMIPFLLYCLGTAISLGFWAVRRALSAGLIAAFPQDATAISSLAETALPLALLLGPLIALPAAYRLIVQLLGAPAAAMIVAGQLTLQLLLAVLFTVLGHGSALAPALAGHATFVLLVTIALSWQGHTSHMIREQP